MSSLNRAQLIGVLGCDPELRYTPPKPGQEQGQAVANFTLATDESYTDKDGTKQERTEWHRIVVWGKVAEAYVGPYLKKGMRVYVEGKIQTREWEKDGQKRSTTEINVSNIIGLTPKAATAPVAAARPAARPITAARTAQSYTRPAARPTAHTAPHPQEISDEDVPF